MGKKSRRFKQEIKRAMSCRHHPPEKVVPSAAKLLEDAIKKREKEAFKNNDITNEEIRKFEQQHSPNFHEDNDEEAIRKNLQKINEEEMNAVDWGRWCQ